MSFAKRKNQIKVNESIYYLFGKHVEIDWRDDNLVWVWNVSQMDDKPPCDVVLRSH